MKIIVNLVLFCFFFIPLSADEIIQDKNGDFFLMKDDGTFKKLPRPKPGHKYVIKKTKKYLEDKKIQIFSKPKKKLEEEQIVDLDE